MFSFFNFILKTKEKFIENIFREILFYLSDLYLIIFSYNKYNDKYVLNQDNIIL